MKASGEYGEFFPIEASPFAYNESLANEQLPLSKNEILARGWNWQGDDEEKARSYVGPTHELAQRIEEVEASICEKILRCEATGKPYRIVEPEFRFYKRLKIPLPRVCPDVRHARRLLQRNPRVLWERKCQECQQEMMTSYAPSRPEKVYCEGCYGKIVFA